MASELIAMLHDPGTMLPIAGVLFLGYWLYDYLESKADDEQYYPRKSLEELNREYCIDITDNAEKSDRRLITKGVESPYKVYGQVKRVADEHYGREQLAFLDEEENGKSVEALREELPEELLQQIDESEDLSLEDYSIEEGEKVKMYFFRINPVDEEESVKEKIEYWLIEDVLGLDRRSKYYVLPEFALDKRSDDYVVHDDIDIIPYHGIDGLYKGREGLQVPKTLVDRESQAFSFEGVMNRIRKADFLDVKISADDRRNERENEPEV